MQELKYKIFVINMPQSVERWEYVKSQISRFGLTCERLDGVDVSTLSQDELTKYYSYQKNRKSNPKPLTKGEIGCHIAHIKSWETIIKQKLDFAIILEDDISLSDNFKNAIDFIKSHLNDWDFIRLQKERKTHRLYSKQDFKDFSIYEFIRHSGGAIGYALNHKTAKKLVDNILPFGITTDTNMHVYYQFDVDVKTLIPPVVFVYDDLNNNSNIDATNPRKNRKNFYPFARQVFSMRAYIGRYCQLVKRDGFFKFLKRILNSKAINPL